MAIITLNDIYDKFKKVSDWVTGADTTSAPKIFIKPSWSVSFGKKTIGTTEVKLSVGASALANRKKLTIRVVGNDAIYIGATGVTTSTGFPLLSGEVKEFLVADTLDLYAIAASNQTAHIIEES